MESFIYYIKNYDWVSCGFQILSVSVLWLYISALKKHNNDLKNAISEVKSHHNPLILSKEQQMDDEMLFSICYWINCLNYSLEERNAFIKAKFPLNEQKIQEYFRVYYEGVPFGMRKMNMYFDSLNS